MECVRVYLKSLIDDSEGSFQCCRHVCFVRNFIGVTEVMGSCSSRQSNIDFDGEGKTNRIRADACSLYSTCNRVIALQSISTISRYSVQSVEDHTVK